MIYLMMTDETYQQVPEAMTAMVEGDQVVCRTREGNIVAMIEAVTVTAYGISDALRDPATVDVVLLRQPLPL